MSSINSVEIGLSSLFGIHGINDATNDAIPLSSDTLFHLLSKMNKEE